MHVILANSLVRPAVVASFVLAYRIHATRHTTVFRELLQNSDDASAKAVEIHFETKAYVAKREGGETVDVDAAGDGAVEKLPDLKTAIVRRVHRSMREQAHA